MKKLLLYCTVFIFLTHAKAQKSPEYLWGRNAGGVAISSEYDNKIHSVSIFHDSASINGQTFIGLGGNDILITQSTSTGQHIWTKHYGGIYDEYVYAITTDINGNIYISGQFSTQTIFDNDTLNGSGSDNIFLVKLDKSGTVIWCKAITDGFYNHIQNNIAADNTGNILMSASITIGNGDTITLGQDHFIGDNSEDIYLIKYSSDGDIIWAKRDGGNKIDRTYGITIDKDNNIYTSGYFTDTAYFGHGMYTSHNPQGSIYFAKYDSSGNIQYLKTPKLGGNGTGLDITFSDDGYLYMCGTISDTTVLGNCKYPVIRTS